MALRCEDPKLIIHVINFELTQHTCHSTSTSQTDRRTNYNSNTALALRASHGKNVYKPPVVGVIFLPSHQSIKYVFVALGLERFQDENYRRQVDPLVIGERQVRCSMTQVVQYDCLTRQNSHSKQMTARTQQQLCLDFIRGVRASQASLLFAPVPLPGTWSGDQGLGLKSSKTVLLVSKSLVLKSTLVLVSHSWC